MSLLIFDLDGTLLDSRASILNSIVYALQEIGQADLHYDVTKAVQQDLRLTLWEAGLRNDIRFSDQTIEEFVVLYRKHHEMHAGTTMPAYPNAAEVLTDLRADFSLAIATTKDSRQAAHVLRCQKMDHLFDHIQGTDDGMKYKPEPDILHRVLDQLEKKSEKAVYIGDSNHDIEAAKSAGMKSVGAAYGFAGFKELKKSEPDWMIQNLNELLTLKGQIKETFNRG